MPGEPERIRYRAFLSYSHRDKRAAKRWHRRLEAFQIDPDLIGRPTEHGAVPPSLSPILRDRLDFPSGGGTGGSDLVCDATVGRAGPDRVPQRRESHYVNEEVRNFRHHFPGHPLVIVLEDGEGWNPAVPALSRFRLVGQCLADCCRLIPPHRHGMACPCHLTRHTAAIDGRYGGRHGGRP